VIPAWLDHELPSPERLQERLELLVPPQLDPENHVRRLVAARAIYVMLYGYAIEGSDTWIRPTTVIDMTPKQAAKLVPADRRAWLSRVQSARRPKNVPRRWYSENSRETIRDEALRRLVELGIVVQRPGVATSSPKPRYALATSVLPVFAPQLTGGALQQAVEAWQKKHLSAAALARLALDRKGAAPGTERVRITLPNGETRHLASGPSAELTRAVVEEFAPRFLARPAVLLVSESAQKISYRDEDLLKATGLRIEAATTLPDVVMMDLDDDTHPPLLVFVECFATGGAINEPRRAALQAIATAGGFAPEDTAYVTVFKDRARSPFRGHAAALAWGSFAWFVTEPEDLVFFRKGATGARATLAALLRAER
jgi:hypothetical protein